VRRKALTALPGLGVFGSLNLYRSEKRRGVLREEVAGTAKQSSGILWVLCMLEARKLWDLKVVNRDVANAPAAPSDRRFGALLHLSTPNPAAYCAVRAPTACANNAPAPSKLLHSAWSSGTVARARRRVKCRVIAPLLLLQRRRRHGGQPQPPKRTNMRPTGLWLKIFR